MAIGIIIAVLCILLSAGAGVLAYKNKKARKNNVYIIVPICVAIAMFVVFLIVPFSIRTVKAGEVAVVKHLGEAREIKTAGTYFDFWVTEKYEKYDATVQNLTIQTPAYSKDAQTMDLEMTVQFQIDTTKAIEIVNKYGALETLSNRISSVSIEKTKAILTKYSAMEIIENRANISPEVENVIKSSIDENYCVNIVAVVLTNIDFSDAFEATVENKMIAEQEKLKAEYEKETAIVNAEKELEVAKLNAQAKIAQAEADAEARIKVAEAEATAIKLKSIEVARSLGFDIVETEIKDENGMVTDIEYEIDFEGKTAEEIALIVDYLKYAEYLAKWDGKLPEVLTDSNATVMIPTTGSSSNSAGE